jgi:hypothetical protein
MKGVTAQRLSGLLHRHVSGLAACWVGEQITTGLDGGTDFSFVVNSRDGSELLVSVVQTKPPTGAIPLASPHQIKPRPQIITIPRRSATRERMRLEHPVVPAPDDFDGARVVRQRERNRRRFLGEI